MKINVSWKNALEDEPDGENVRHSEIFDIESLPNVARLPKFKATVFGLINERYPDHDPYEIRWQKDNESSLEHRVHSGSKFYCECCDLSAPIYFEPDDPYASKADWAKDVAEFIGWHATNIRPDLTGLFQGYDCIEFKERKGK